MARLPVPEWFLLFGGGAVSVSSFNTRTGAVVPASGDYDFAQIAGPFVPEGVQGIPSGAANIAATTGIAYPTTLTAASIWSLPSAASMPAGTVVWFVDPSQLVTASHTITAAPNGTDKIMGANSNLLILNAAGQMAQFTTDGVANWTVSLSNSAPLASPALTGTPTAPTAAALTNNTQLATTAYADTADTVVGKSYFGGQSGFPNIVATMNPLYNNATIVWPASNRLLAYRVVVPATGTLSAITIFVQASSGNIGLAIYDCGATTTNTFTRLATTGAVACPSGTAWQTVAGISLAVTAGQNLMFALSADNTTFSTQIYSGSGNTQGKSTLPTGFLPGGGTCAGVTGFYIATSHPPPTTIAVASINQLMYPVCIMCVIT